MSVHPRTPQTPPALYLPSSVASSTTLRPPPRAPLSRVHQELVSIRRRVRGPTYSTGSVTDNGIVFPFLSLPLSLSLPLLFIFLFFPRFFTSLLLPPSVSTPPRGFSLFSPSSSSLFRERGVLFSYSLSTPPSPSASYQESRVIGSRRPVFASTFAARVPSRDLRQRRTSRRVENFFSFDRDAFSA